MKEYKRYIEDCGLQDATHIEVSVSYSKTSPRGYYISVTPVTKRDGMISFILFSGYRKFLFKANRYCDKQFNRAVEMSRDFEPRMVAAVREKYKAA